MVCTQNAICPWAKSGKWNSRKRITFPGHSRRRENLYRLSVDRQKQWHSHYLWRVLPDLENLEIKMKSQFRFMEAFSDDVPAFSPRSSGSSTPTPPRIIRVLHTLDNINIVDGRHKSFLLFFHSLRPGTGTFDWSLHYFGLAVFKNAKIYISPADRPVQITDILMSAIKLPRPQMLKIGIKPRRKVWMNRKFQSERQFHPRSAGVGHP